MELLGNSSTRDASFAFIIKKNALHLLDDRIYYFYTFVLFLLPFFNQKNYVLIKDITLAYNKLAPIIFTKIISLLTLMFSFIGIPIILTHFLIFGSLRQFVKLILRIKIGRSFGGLLDGTDIIWAIEDQSKSIINILVVIKYNENNSEKFMEFFKRLIYERLLKQQRFPKLTAIRAQYLGYQFLINNQFSLNDCVKLWKTECEEKYLTKEVLNYLVGDCMNREMPKNNSALWEVLISEQPVKWSMGDFVEFPVLFRVHHSLIDGISLVRLLVEKLADGECKIMQQQETPTSKNKFKVCLQNLCIFLFSPAIMAMQLIMRDQDDNVLHGNDLIGEKLTAMAVEENPSVIKTIKDVKNLSDSKFSEILLSAISASFLDFYKQVCYEVWALRPYAIKLVQCKIIAESLVLSTMIEVIDKNQDVPDFITAVIPALINPVPQEKMGNSTFSVAMLNLPIRLESHNLQKSSVKRLKEVKIQCGLLRNSPDYKVNYWLLNVISAVLPEPILRPLLLSAHSTMIISNVPGSEKIHFGGHEISDIVFWLPHRGKTGVGLSILSYDSRLQLGLSVDKALISSQGELQMILDGIFKHINLLKDDILAFST